MPQTTDEQLAKAQRAIRGGFSIRTAAAAAGIPESTLRYHLNGRKRASGGAEDGDGLLGSASDEFVEIPVITRDYSHLERLRVYPLGDIHLGSPAHAAERWQQWREYLEGEADASLMMTGDLFNAALKDSKSEAYDEAMTVGAAIKLARRQFEPLAAAGRIDVMVPGNHEARVYRATGIDPVEVVADALGAPYARAAVLLRYIVGSVEYHVYLRHGTGNAGGMVGSRANQLQRGAHVVQADVHVSGHTHSLLATADRQFHFEGGRMVARKRVYVASSSFLHYEAYAAERGYVAGVIGAPRIFLDGTRKDVHISI